MSEAATLQAPAAAVEPAASENKTAPSLAAPGETPERAGAASDGAKPPEAPSLEAKPGGEKAPPVKPEIAKPEVDADPVHEIEIGGRKHQVSLSELKEAFVASVESHHQVETAQALANEAEKFFSSLQRDPIQTSIDFFEDAGMPRPQAYERVLQAAGKMVNDWWEFQQRPEAERKALSLEDKLRHTEEENRRLMTEHQRIRSEEAEYQAMKQLSAWIPPALQAVGLPSDRDTLIEIGNRLGELRSRGIPVDDKSVLRVAKTYKREQDSRSESFESKRLKELDAERLLGLRPDLEEYMSKRALAKVEAKNSERKSGGIPPSKDEPRKKVVYREFSDLFEKK